MNKIINYFAGTLTAFLTLCGESLSTPALLAVSVLTAVFLWLSIQIHQELKAHKFDKNLPPIAAATARDLGIEVDA